MAEGQLAQCVTHEPESDYPVLLEIVAYFRNDRRGKVRRVSISADQFFGRGGYGAPMSGDQIIGIINQLRK